MGVLRTGMPLVDPRSMDVIQVETDASTDWGIGGLITSAGPVIPQLFFSIAHNRITASWDGVSDGFPPRGESLWIYCTHRLWSV